MEGEFCRGEVEGGWGVDEGGKGCWWGVLGGEGGEDERDGIVAGEKCAMVGRVGRGVIEGEAVDMVGFCGGVGAMEAGFV